jgi:very-short-patch-repair endonuclease
MVKILNKSNLTTLRRKLRRNQTPAEFSLWLCLRNRKLENKKFVRQFSINNFIYDFYCAEERLLIELDGDTTHSGFEANKKDILKEQNAKNLGYKVIRYKNTEVLNNLNEVLEDIKSYFKYI